MGLIKAIKGATGGVFADQWREYFYCESMDSHVLVTKGEKRTSKKRSSNKKGNENIISNGSIVAVNDGQCMIIVEQGKIVEVCAEPGEFIYDTSSEASIFYGGLSEGIKKSFQTIGKRFTFGGDTAKDQRIYFFNTKELVGNKYGTPNPVPFRVVDRNIGLDVDIAIRCHGEYSYRIKDPILFYTNVCGNIEEIYTRDEIDGQLRTELMTALQPAFAHISDMGIRYSSLPGHTMEIANVLNQVLSEKWAQLRGIEVVSFGINTLKASEEDEAMIKELQRNASFKNPTMAAAHLVGAQARAMQDAAKNEGQGAFMAFAGMNAAGNAGGINAKDLYRMGQIASEEEKIEAPKTKGEWICTCGTKNHGKFCTECASPRPSSWTCPCGTENKGKFCYECGKPKPENEPLYKCDKCGWEPEDPRHPTKFCPECGDVFDENDITN